MLSLIPFFLLPFSLSFEYVEFAKPVFKDGKFQNPPSFTNWTGVPGFSQITKLFFKEKKKGKIPNENVLNKTLPVIQLTNFSAKSPLYAAWLGHSTVLIHMNGANFLTDPIWSKRAGPVPYLPFGAKRYRSPPMEIVNLPKIDFVMISHDHYDHLDKVAVNKIAELNPNMTWFVPLGLKKWLIAEKVGGNKIELNWGESTIVSVNGKDFTIWCLPAQHWGQRNILDRNEHLWSGWAVVGPTKKFYYSGDTGFCHDEFVKIGKKFGFFDLAAIPIGCFQPRWFMQAQHIGPMEAVEIHKLVKSKLSIGLHWGTYDLGAYESYLEPKKYLNSLMEKEQEIRKDTYPFITLNAGEIWEQK